MALALDLLRKLLSKLFFLRLLLGLLPGGTGAGFSSLQGGWCGPGWRLIAWPPMPSKASPKCLHCNESFVADPRNQWHQRFCRKPVCQHASKADSQRRWTLKPGNETYFSGAVSTERVRVWRLANPNYRRKKMSAPESVQQDVLNLQVAAIETVTPPEPRSVLQEICCKYSVRLGRKVWAGVILCGTRRIFPANKGSECRSPCHHWPIFPTR